MESIIFERDFRLEVGNGEKAVKAGETYQGKVEAKHGEFCNLNFGDEGIAYGVNVNNFKVVDRKFDSSEFAQLVMNHLESQGGASFKQLDRDVEFHDIKEALDTF